ncbi:thioredoxin, partial [Aulographum hederae CBS 113979]
ISSSSHLNTVLSSNIYVIADFYADWCGPCKTIAPIFEQLAAQETKAGKVAFVKIDVDAQQDIAKTYGVSAMPTFLVLKNSKVTETIRGANPSALRSAVTKAAADARGAAPKSFQSKGYTLGSASGANTAGGSGSGIGGLQGMGLSAVGGLPDTLVRFVALYLTSLFAFDAFEAAGSSSFAV